MMAAKPLRRHFGPDTKRQRRLGDEDMTLCIAALANEDRMADSVVCCFDKRVETETSGSETGLKFRQIGSYAAAMIAGSVPRAEQLIGRIKDGIGWYMKSTPSLLEQLRPHVHSFRRSLVNGYVQSVLSMDYEELLRDGEKIIPDSLRTAVFEEITRIDLGCELIVMTIPGESNPDLQVCTIHKDGTILQQTNFCAIGTGSPNAESWLHFRQQSSGYSIERTMLHVYEAKRFSESAPGVGKQTIAIVLSAEKEGNLKIIHEDGFKPLAKMWSKYGPRTTKTKEIEVTIIDASATIMTWHPTVGPREKLELDTDPELEIR